MHILGENTVTKGNSKGKNLGRNIPSMFKEQPDWCGWVNRKGGAYRNAGPCLSAL